MTTPQMSVVEVANVARPTLAVLAKIADAYDDNGLDDEARKFWGANDEHQNTTPPDAIELYDGRGGRRLLTLADCLAARTALATLDRTPASARAGERDG